MAIRIITDSASDLAPSPALTVVPLTVTFGETSYLDGVDLSAHRFYELLVENDQLPSTSQINPGTWDEAFREATASGDEVVCITLSSKLSGTYQSACIAAEAYPTVHVVDSLNVTVGEGVLVRRALELAQAGLEADELVNALDAEKRSIRVVALLDTLEYLKRGGRVSGGTALVGTMLSIKPVVAVQDGLVEVIGKARGSKNGHNLLVREIQNGGGIDVSRPLATGFTGLDDRILRKYIQDAGCLWEDLVSEVPVYEVGSTIGTHAGPGAIAVAFFSQE